MKYIYRFFSLVLIFFSVSTHAEKYTLAQMLNFLGINDSKVTLIETETCNGMPFETKPLCDELEDDLPNYLYVNDHDLVYQSSYRGDKRLKSKYYLQELDIFLKVNGETAISFGSGGSTFNELFYPYVAKVDLHGYIGGDGEVEYRYTYGCVPLVGCDDYEEDLDVDVDGNFSVSAYFALAFNPHFILDTQNNKYIMTLQPQIRVIPSNLSHNLDFDVDSGLGILIFEQIDSLANLSNAAFNLSFLQFEQLETDIAKLGDSLGGVLVNTVILADDLSGDRIFELAADIINEIYSDDLNDTSDRFFYDLEHNLQTNLLAALNADENGIVKKEIALPTIHGKAFSEILPAIQLALQ